MSKLIKVEYLRSNEVNDIFKETYSNGKVEYISFPRTLEITVENLKEAKS